MPIGYLLLGMVLTVVAVGCGSTAAFSDSVLSRAVFGLVAVLSMVLVEALWCMRPWVVRAMDAWAAVCVGAVLVPVLVVAASGAGFDLFVMVTLAALTLVGFPCAVARWYVRDRAVRLGLLPGRVP